MTVALPADLPADRRSTRWRARGLLVVALLVMLTVAASYLAVTVPAALSARTESTDRSAALVTAKQGATGLLSYDYRAADASLERTRRLAVPGLATKLRDNWPAMRNSIVFGQAVAKAVVKAAAVERLQSDKALVLVFLDQTTRTAAEPEPRTTAYRVAVTLQKSEGHWLLTGVQPQ